MTRDRVKISAAGLLVITLILLAATIPANAQNLVCAGCGKPISSGTWVQAEGKTYHPEHFTCANCRQPIGKKEFLTNDGKLYDRECYDKLFALRCTYCGRKLTGKYTTVEDKPYHESCYIEHVAPRWGVCDKPIQGTFVVFGGKSYHESCYQSDVAIKCDYCGGLIEDREYRRNYWGDNYHTAHEGKAQECDFCQRLISPALRVGSREWSDGRILCGHCAPTAVTSPEAAESILVVVAVKLRMFGIDVDPAGVRVSLVDRKELDNLRNGEAMKPRGFTNYLEKTSLFGWFKRKKLDVYLLFGMTRSETMYVMAHELMHVWQYLNGQVENDKALCEGSCMYAAYLVMRDQSNAQAKYLTDKPEQDPDPYYGEGYRRVKAYVDKVGIAAWLEYLKTNPKAPW